MGQDRDTNLALFVDFDNVALGARDARQRFDIKLLLQRVLEKGKIIVKRAYADWHFYKEHMTPLHEAAIELIEIPMPRISGKNSADIKLVVDAMDLCYSKDHIDTFVIVSGDSDFSPLVSKLRENNKRVIGIGVKNSSSHLLINNCDEFIFYDDIYRDAMGQMTRSATNVPADKRDLFDFLVATAQSLLQESRGVLYSSLIKDTMTRKQPDFNERNYGFSNFGDLLEESRRLGLLVVERDARAGGTWVVQGLGEGSSAEPTVISTTVAKPSRRRRSRGRGRGAEGERGAGEAAAAEGARPQESAGEPRDGNVKEATVSQAPPMAGKDSSSAVGAQSEATKPQTPKLQTPKPPTEGAQSSGAEGQSPSSTGTPSTRPARGNRSRRKSSGGGPGSGTSEVVKQLVGRESGKAQSPEVKAAPKITTPKKAAPAKAVTKKATSAKTSDAKTAPATKTATKKAPAKKATAKNTAASKAVTKKTPAAKPAVKKATKKTVKKAGPEGGREG